jgi:hypothetical protein
VTALRRWLALAGGAAILALYLIASLIDETDRHRKPKP